MPSISFDNALGIHQTAMPLRAHRAEILANNLANADTPGFKARDVNFKAILNGESKAHQSVAMERTHTGHLTGQVSRDDELLYRNPSQPSIDGNTVDTQIEQALFSRNNISYEASFEFLSGRFKGMKNAIRGGE